FSSRRRHTRSKRDWSSDVCSSDLPSEIVVLFNQAPHPQGLYSAVDTGMTFFSLPSFILKFLPPSLAKPGTGAGAGGGRLNVYDEIGRASCRERCGWGGCRVCGEGI